MPCSRAARAASSVVGPAGIGSAVESAVSSASGTIAKYGESVSSWRQTSFAPSPAAIAMPRSITATCSSASGCHASWTAAIRNGGGGGASPRGGGGGGGPPGGGGGGAGAGGGDG